MIKFAFGVLVAAAAISPAHAVTIVTLVPANSTFPNAPIIQSFSTPNVNNSPFLINNTNTSPIPNSPAGVESIVGTVRTSSATLTGLGTTDDYLVIGNQSSYTINFSAAPLSFFSFAFNSDGNNNRVTLTYDDLTTQIFQSNPNGGEASLRNFGLGPLADALARSGRLIYDTGTGPKILAAEFARNGNSSFFVIDDIAVAAPEPATWLMMILGFGLVGSQLRRRRTKVKVKFATA